MAIKSQQLKRVLLNLGASGFGKVSIALIRFVQVPLLIGGLGVEDYGRWLILSSIPTWLTLANLGFGSVAGNEMSMLVSQGDLLRAKKIFSSCLFLVLAITVAGSCISFVGSFFVPWESILNGASTRHSEFARAAFFLAVSIFLSFWGEIFGGRFRAAMKTHQGITLVAIRPWIDLGMLGIALLLSKRFDYLAASLLISNTLYLLTVWFMSFKAMPELTASRSNISFSEIPGLFKKGSAFQAFPLGNAILFQGNLMIVQSLIGPVGVALFGSVRTLVRSVNQVMEMVNQSIWPELSHLLGAKNLVEAARVHRWGVLASTVFALAATLILSVVGLPLFHLWTHSRLELTHTQLLLFLLPIPFNALWYTSSVVHAACNRHGQLAVRYLISTSIGAVTCYLLTWVWGINGAAVSTLIVDLILIPFVFQKSLQLTGDTAANFRKETFLTIQKSIGMVGLRLRKRPID